MSVQALLRKSVVTATVVALSAMASPASAQVLFGAANGQSGGQAESSLYSIDPGTGAADLIGPIGFRNVSGMACLPDGRMVASANADNIQPPGPVSVLIEIDPDTGAGSLIGTIGDLNQGSCGRFPDITFDNSSGTLFGYGDFCSGDPEGLFTIDPITGAGTSVGASGYGGGGNGLAAQPGTGTLYGTPFDISSLVIFDPVTGAGSDVPGSVGAIPFRVNALDFNPVSGELLGSYNDGSFGYLVSIDTADGSTTIIGQSATGLDALTHACDFEPSEFARFRVTKDFTDNNDAEVAITLSCNTGLPLEQHWNLSEDNPVNFVVGDFEQGALNCTVSEDGDLAGYTASYNDGSPSDENCSWTGAFGSQYFCNITNTLQPSEVEVNKVWIDENPSFNPVNYAEAEWDCSNVAQGSDDGTLEFYGNPAADYFSVYPDWESGTTCSVTELFLADGGVEVDSSECATVVLYPGESASCTIYNTRLYEGIPTLSQYGLAILSMLMLGIGLFAFRRFA